ncbi:MAG: energy transducer TonB [Clostridium sp.]|nr:energy transducer TonB [Prevotella sp.]MCM1428581.1 energy transducer TonB [Clostridium sp.]MCM1474944.1 energy transducer TonB [Muribaculaceae bacterium]
MKRFLLSLLCVGGMLMAFADTTPQFPGGETALAEYLKTNMVYPQVALDNGIEGVVEVSFTVKTDGTIGAIKIVRMLDPDLEQEAIRLVKGMPAWTPAEGASGAVVAPAKVKIAFELPE